MKKQSDEIIDEWDGERIEGIDAIRRFLSPKMSRSQFYREHREALKPYLIEYKDSWRKTGHGIAPRPRYFTFKRLLILYMLRRRTI